MTAGARHLRLYRQAFRAVAICGLACVLGCSVKKNYKVLSFFFDGVPDPNAPAKADVQQASGGLAPGVAAPPPKMFRHKPFAQGQCEACHAADKKHLLTVKAELCLKCHAPAVKQYPVMHAPVAVGQCLWCHEPHESDSPELLKTTAPQLCLQCHDQNLLPSDVKPHQSDEANCLSCHVGHGGSKPSLLLIDNPNVEPISARLSAATRQSGAGDAADGEPPPAGGGVP